MMITEKQINWIAALPEDTDFRLQSFYGQTTVVVKQEGKVIAVYENGDVFWFTDKGMSALVDSPGFTING